METAPEPLFKRPRLALAAALVTTVLGLLLLGPVESRLEPVLEWVRDLKAWGPVMAGILYLPAAVLLIPGTLLTLGVGYLFGVPLGLLIVFVGQTLGMSTSFFLGRYLAREWVASRVGQHPRFARLDKVLGERGFRIVFLSRLSFVLPYNFMNYFFGLSSMPYWKYLAASLLGMLPETLLFLYLASAARSLPEALARARSASPAWEAMVVVGLAALIALYVFLSRFARQALQEPLTDAPAASPSPPPDPPRASAGEEVS